MPSQDLGAAQRILKSLPAREREAMIRFYLERQTPEQIQSALGISEADFLVLRRRAKEEFLRLRRKSEPHHCHRAAAPDLARRSA